MKIEVTRKQLTLVLWCIRAARDHTAYYSPRTWKGGKRLDKLHNLLYLQKENADEEV